MKITELRGREIYDSRGYPTIECILILDDEYEIRASVPTGMSRSAYEAYILRDEGKRLDGMGVSKAIHNLENIIAPALIKKQPNLVQMDVTMLELDGTEDKSKLGANAILAASIAVCRAQAYLENLELYEFIAYLCDFDSVMIPGPMINVVNGGLHAHNNLQIQEFMLVPLGYPNFRTAFEACTSVFHNLGKLLKKNEKFFAVGDEGGFASNFNDDMEALDYIVEAIETIKIKNENILISLDVAASQFYNAKHKYVWHGKSMQSAELIALYEDLIKRYPLYGLEDGMAEQDLEGWQAMCKQLGSKVHVVADDIFATNPQRIWQGIEESIAYNVIIKPDQIGTVTETLQAIKLCQEYEIPHIVSHRSGETLDTFIVDLAVGTSASQIKAGGCSRSERLAKYNRLLEIEDDLLEPMFEE